MLVLISAVVVVAVAYPFNEQAFRMNNFERVYQQRHPPHMEEASDCFCVEDGRGNRVCQPPHCDSYRTAKVDVICHIYRLLWSLYSRFLLLYNMCSV